MSDVRLAVIPGDGIGTEVIEQALRVLDTVLPGVARTHYELGALQWHRSGEPPRAITQALRFVRPVSSDLGCGLREV